MSVFNRKETVVSTEILERGELQLNLMKMMAEQGHEKFLEYYRENDTVILSEIQDGHFHVLETVEGFISRQNMVLNRIYEKDQELYRVKIQKCLAKPSHSVFDVRYVIPEVGPRWYRMFLMSVGDESGYVTKFYFDTVKIDRSMILNIVHDEKNRLILKHTIAMLKELGMEIVIEGVETAEQVAVLAELGCDTVQGFFFGKPEPEEQFYELYMS